MSQTRHIIKQVRVANVRDDFFHFVPYISTHVLKAVTTNIVHLFVYALIIHLPECTVRNTQSFKQTGLLSATVTDMKCEAMNMRVP
jgi:hypothetical protein